MDAYTQHIRDHFFVEGFWTKNEEGSFVLSERDKGGESQLFFRVHGQDNLAICNVDKKDTQLNFFIDTKTEGLKKRVDHIVLEKRGEDEWVAHLIEMKSHIPAADKWYDVKAKFRASYLLVQALCAIMHIHLIQIYMYTTYEKINLEYEPENMIARRTRTGLQPLTPKDEWDGGKFTLKFGDCLLPFIHIPIHMTKNENKILVGEYEL